MGKTKAELQEDLNHLRKELAKEQEARRFAQTERDAHKDGHDQLMEALVALLVVFEQRSKVLDRPDSKGANLQARAQARGIEQVTQSVRWVLKDYSRRLSQLPADEQCSVCTGVPMRWISHDHTHYCACACAIGSAPGDMWMATQDWRKRAQSAFSDGLADNPELNRLRRNLEAKHEADLVAKDATIEELRHSLRMEQSARKSGARDAEKLLAELTSTADELATSREREVALDGRVSAQAEKIARLNAAAPTSIANIPLTITVGVKTQ